MEIKPTGPGNVGFGNVNDTPGVSQPKPFSPVSQTTETQGTEAAGNAELQTLAGLGNVQDLNDPQKAQSMVRSALGSICEPEFANLTQKERNDLVDYMANDPLMKGKTAKLMEKVLRGD